jgi:hypothetical protein
LAAIEARFGSALGAYEALSRAVDLEETSLRRAQLARLCRSRARGAEAAEHFWRAMELEPSAAGYRDEWARTVGSLDLPQRGSAIQRLLHLLRQGVISEAEAEQLEAKLHGRD